jgi:hypothetical protein
MYMCRSLMVIVPTGTRVLDLYSFWDALEFIFVYIIALVALRATSTYVKR